MGIDVLTTIDHIAADVAVGPGYVISVNHYVIKTIAIEITGIIEANDSRIPGVSAWRQ